MKHLALVLFLGGCASLPPASTPDIAPARLTGDQIDVHYHANFPGDDAAEARKRIFANLERENIGVAVIALTDYADFELYDTLADDRLITAAMLGCPRNTQPPDYWCFPSSQGWIDVGWLEREIISGRIEAIHEVLPNYNGIPLDDPPYRPYFALAAKYDIPVGIHTGRGPGPADPPRSNPGCCPGYDPEAGNPAALRSVLDRHPDLRIWIEHVGAGNREHPYYWEEALALLRDYPNVYFEMSIANSLMPLPIFEAGLKRMIDAGFGDRLMFGSDNMPMEAINERFASIVWLSDEQRRAIRRENAARFFRLNAR